MKNVQKTGESVRDMWHKADWDKVCLFHDQYATIVDCSCAQVKQDPKSIQMPREAWIFEFDAAKNVEERFDKVVADL